MSVKSVGSLFETQSAPKSTQGSKSAADLAAEFAEALKASGLMLNGANGLSATEALKAAFERAHTPQVTEPATRSAEPKADRHKAERSDDRPEQDRRPEEKADTANTPVGAAPISQPAPEVQTVAQPVTDGQNQPALDQGVVVAEEQVIVQPVLVDEAIAIVNAPVTTEIVTDANVGVVDPAVAATVQPVEQAVGKMAANAPVMSDMNAQAAKPEAAIAEDMVEVAAKPVQATQNQTAQKPASDLAAAQAEDMAVQLDDTGVQLNIKVDADPAKPRAANSQNAAQPQLVVNVDGQPQQPGQGQGQSLAQGQQKPTLAQQTEALKNNQVVQNAVDPAKAFNGAQFAPVVGVEPQLTPSVQGAQTGSGAAAPVVGVAPTGANGLRAPHAPQAPAQAPQTPRTMPTAQNVVDQISVQIRSAQAGDTIKINLKPAELGAIEVKIDLGADGRVAATVTADNKDTLSLLQRDSRALEKALQEAGLDIDNKNLSFQMRDGQSQNASDQAPKRRSRLAAARAAEAANAEAIAQAQARYNTGRGGVDIKV